MLLCVKILHNGRHRLYVGNTALAKVLNDGLSLCHVLFKHVRRDTGGIPVIMLTARSRMGDVEEAFSVAADDFITKPFEWEELLGKVNRALATGQLGHA